MNYDSFVYESSIFDLITINAIMNSIYLSSKYEDLKKIFNEKKSDKLTKHDSFNHATKTIDVKSLNQALFKIY
jgi:hypothetical protein